MTAKQREQYDKFPANLTRGLLIVEDRLAEALPNLANALRSSSLDPKLREGVILRVAALHANAYKRMQNLEQAGKIGWSEAEIAGIEAGLSLANSSAMTALLPFIEGCVAEGEVSDPTFKRVQDL